MDVKKEVEDNDDLPPIHYDLLVDILSWLPVKPLIRWTCISKLYYDLIKSPSFIKLHLSRSDEKLLVFGQDTTHTIDLFAPLPQASTLDYPKHICRSGFGSIGSCNGLLCFLSNNASRVVLHNPITRAYKTLPDYNCSQSFMRFETLPYVGFAYDSIADDYKVLRIIKLVCRIFGTIKWETILYGMRENTWEIIENPPLGWDSVSLIPASVVNNRMHWMKKDSLTILGFDMSTGKYNEMSFPKKIHIGYHPTICVVRGKLAVVTYYLDVWILNEYGIHESWTLVNRSSFAQWNPLYDQGAIRGWNEGVSVVSSRDGRKIGIAIAGRVPRFICCDLDGEIRMIEITGLPKRLPNALPWLESLVPL